MVSSDTIVSVFRTISRALSAKRDVATTTGRIDARSSQARNESPRNHQVWDWINIDQRDSQRTLVNPIRKYLKHLKSTESNQHKSTKTLPQLEQFPSYSSRCLSKTCLSCLILYHMFQLFKNTCIRKFPLTVFCSIQKEITYIEGYVECVARKWQTCRTDFTWASRASPPPAPPVKRITRATIHINIITTRHHQPFHQPHMVIAITVMSITHNSNNSLAHNSINSKRALHTGNQLRHVAAAVDEDGDAAINSIIITSNRARARSRRPRLRRLFMHGAARWSANPSTRTRRLATSRASLTSVLFMVSVF